jgi:hypothetical protein
MKLALVGRSDLEQQRSQDLDGKKIHHRSTSLCQFAFKEIALESRPAGPSLNHRPAGYRPASINQGRDEALSRSTVWRIKVISPVALDECPYLTRKGSIIIS